jgi:hypothetical protein
MKLLCNVKTGMYEVEGAQNKHVIDYELNDDSAR